MADINSVLEQANALTEEDRTKFLTEFIGRQNVLWLSKTVKAIEEKFGVKAQAAVAVAAGAAPAAAGPKKEEAKTTFDVILKGLKDPNARLNVIKAVREVTKLGLQEAKGLVDGVPKPLKQGVPKEEAEKVKKDIEAAGGDVEIK